jgi:hypothetical protein
MIYVIPQKIWPPLSIKDTGSRLHTKLKEVVAKVSPSNLFLLAILKALIFFQQSASVCIFFANKCLLGAVLHIPYVLLLL